jgi:hexosaminidase
MYFLKMCRYFVAAITITLLSSMVYADSLPAQFQIMPLPRNSSVAKSAGAIQVDSLKGIYLSTGIDRPVMGPILSSLPVVAKPGKGTVEVRISKIELPVAPEGYVLVVGKDLIEISANDAAGLFYGLATLEQMLQDSRDTQTPLPICTIEDWPTLVYRAVHIDTKHHLDQVGYYYDLIDRLAAIKINAIIWEFEDKLGYRSQPKVAAPQAISIEEMAAITRYARRRHIEISPLVQGLGHASFVLKHKEYHYLRDDAKSDWAFCPINEETYKVQFDLYRDAMLATPGSRFLHVGGDEVNVGKSPLSKPYLEKHGKLDLYLYWLRKVCKFAEENGRIPVCWDDMILKHGGVYRSTHDSKVNTEQAKKEWQAGYPKLDALLERFPKNCYYMRWNYTMANQPGNLLALDWYRDRGLKAMIATAAQNTKLLLPQADRVNVTWSFDNIAAKRGIKYSLSTAWDDSSPHMETYWRGLVAAGEYGWSPQGRSLAEFEPAYLQRAFGPKCIEYTKLYADLTRVTDFWDRAFCMKGNRRGKFTTMELPDKEKPGAWSKKHKTRLDIAKAELDRAEQVRSQLDTMQNTALRNRYHLELLSSINDFALCDMELLLALRRCDVPGAQERRAAREGVKASLVTYQARWQTMLDVYAKVRLPGNPPGYLLDTTHHIAGKSNDYSWMTGPEDAFHSEVAEWLKKR